MLVWVHRMRADNDPVANHCCAKGNNQAKKNCPPPRPQQIFWRRLHPAGRRLRHWVVPGKEWDILAFWDIDPDGVVRSSNEIIALERAPQSPSLDPHDGIFLIKAFIAVEYLDRNGIALYALGTPRQGLLDDIAQESVRVPSIRKFRAANYSLQLGSDILVSRRRSRGADERSTRASNGPCIPRSPWTEASGIF